MCRYSCRRDKLKTKYLEICGDGTVTFKAKARECQIKIYTENATEVYGCLNFMHFITRVIRKSLFHKHQLPNPLNTHNLSKLS